MDRSPGFGSTPTDFTRSSHLVSLRLPSLLEVNLASRRNSPDRSTKSTRLCSCTSTACKHRVSGSLSLPSRGPFHLSFTVLCAIGHWGGPPSFPQGSSCLVVLWIPLAEFFVSYTGLSPSLAGFPKTILLHFPLTSCGPNPRMLALWFRLFPFRSPLLRKSIFLSLPLGT